MFLIVMGTPKIGTSKEGKPMHYSVGAIISRINPDTSSKEYFLIDRKKEPFGWAGIAGHIDEDDLSPEAAAKREIIEESGRGFQILQLEHLAEEEIPWNTCSRGVNCHYWHLFTAEIRGEAYPKPDEIKRSRWFSIENIKKLTDEDKLEPVWKYWFEKLSII